MTTPAAPPLRLGTRRSPLALAQAEEARSRLLAAHPGLGVELVPVTASGDKVLDRPLAEIGGKALWTKELDRALYDREIDASVHSMKDVETIRPDWLHIAAMLPRADVRDRLIGAETIAELRPGAVVGTSSPRRRAQLLSHRPDLVITLLRGNVDTRLAAVAKGEVDATLLAAAGLDRLGREAGQPVPTDQMLPAPAQGAVGIETRADDAAATMLIGSIDHAETHACVMAERSLLAALAADCHSPVAALASLSGEMLTLRAELLAEDGASRVAGWVEGALGEELGARLAVDLLERAAPEVRRLFAGG